MNTSDVKSDCSEPVNDSSYVKLNTSELKFSASASDGRWGNTRCLVGSGTESNHVGRQVDRREHIRLERIVSGGIMGV